MSFEAAFWNSTTVCIVTGASRGIGQRIALDFSKKMRENSCLLLIARNKEGLLKTKSMIEVTSPNVTVLCEEVDLEICDINHMNMIISTLKAKTLNIDFGHAIIVHNAGSIGKLDVGTLQMNDPAYFRRYFDLNVNSVLCLNSAFFKEYHSVSKKTVINITSLAAVVPFPNMGYYCGGKALREAFLRNLALEDQTIKVLSYSPGPVETKMLETILKDAPESEFKRSLSESNILTCEQTVGKLIRILEADQFASGDRIDYFDA